MLEDSRPTQSEAVAEAVAELFAAARSVTLADLDRALDRALTRAKDEPTDWRSDLLDALDAMWTRDHPDEWPARLADDE